MDRVNRVFLAWCVWLFPVLWSEVALFLPFRRYRCRIFAMVQVSKIVLVSTTPPLSFRFTHSSQIGLNSTTTKLVSYLLFRLLWGQHGFFYQGYVTSYWFGVLLTAPDSMFFMWMDTYVKQCLCRWDILLKHEGKLHFLNYCVYVDRA